MQLHQFVVQHDGRNRRAGLGFRDERLLSVRLLQPILVLRHRNGRAQVLLGHRKSQRPRHRVPLRRRRRQGLRHRPRLHLHQPGRLDSRAHHLRRHHR